MGSDWFHRHHQPEEAEQQQSPWVDFRRNSNKPNYLHKFKLYETRSNFYVIGWDKRRTLWKVLKVDRTEPFELNIFEDPAIYSEVECHDLLWRINEGNKSTGGLKFVTICYGIVGFVRFFGPYYMLLITKKRKVGAICGHSVYAIDKSEMIPIPNASVQSNMAYSKNENRYKKLLRSVELTKNFFFSYSYNIMLSLQKNFDNHASALDLYETMFVWNEYLTREIRSQLKNTTWTVALIFGYFKQVTLSVSGKSFMLTLIARRSRHYAGTRYLKRGVNEKGCVANDVETEQIVHEDGCEACSSPISSIVQIRGSIPLFWSQETSRLNIKPDIILSKKDHNYEATRLHFENLVKRYGNPIIIINLVKTYEKKPRESILRAEFANAIDFINKDLSEKNNLKFLHWDLNKDARIATIALDRIVCVAAHALNLTSFFHCDGVTNLRNDDLIDQSHFHNRNWDSAEKEVYDTKIAVEDVVAEVCNNISSAGGHQIWKPLMFQHGVLRTNCIDCLDRTNVAQYAYGLVALGHQLHALGLIYVSTIDVDSPLADDVMKVYEEMGDTLSRQYGGSPAHKKIFSERRGLSRAATKSQEFFRTLQRYYSNTYMDGEKQDSINVFLGLFQPQQWKPALWELDSDQQYNVGRHISDFAGENSWFMKRSLSDGNILFKSNSPVEDGNDEQNQNFDHQCAKKCLAECIPELSSSEGDISYTRHSPPMACRKLLPVLGPDPESDGGYFEERGDSFDYSNFLDFDWLFSSGNSIGEETYDCASESKGERSSSAYASVSGFKGKGRSASDVDVCAEQNPEEYSERFSNWVLHGSLIFL